VDDADSPTGDTDPPAVPSTPGPAVVCDEVVIRYGGTVAVDRLSFVGGPGEVVALLGPNGAGKTSTVEALEGYRPVDSGSVRVLGLDPRRDHVALVPDIGVMLQKGGVYPMLGPAQVLELFSRYYEDPEDPGELLEAVGLSSVRRTPWRRLSGGEQQRLALALALVGRPRVLFLDEPTAGVDPEGRIVVRDIIAGRRDRGICIILTTHELAEAERLADQVVIIDHGRKLAEGSPTALASGTADGSIRFTTEPAIDTAALAGAVGPGTSLVEERPGAYRLLAPPGTASPGVVAVLAGWLAERNLALGDLRTGQSLEEAYLAITGARGTGPESEGTGPEGAEVGGGGSQGGRRRRERGAGRGASSRFSRSSPDTDR
jgi:ABC-2 type transport system ATP-binding protein